MKLARARAAAVAVAALAGAVLVNFSEAILSTRVFFDRDIHAYWYPHMLAFRSVVAEGSLPLWNPWVGFGAPFLADASLAFAYPPTWLALVLPLGAHFKLLAIGHALLAAGGAFALLRRLGAGLPAAGSAGVAYGLSGPLLSALSLYHHYAGAAWMPWVLWALEGLLRRPDRRSALALGATAACQLVVGSGDLVLMTALLGGARLALHVGRAGAGGERARVARALALALGLSACLGAVQWLPTLERAVRGHRATQDLRTQSFWSLHPLSLADLAVPKLVSDWPLEPQQRALLFEGREPLLACLYLGVATLAFAAIGVVLRAPHAPPLAVAAAILLAVSLGRHTPLYGWLVELPVLGLVRYPQKYLLPLSLCVALLAGLGVEAWLRDWSSSERRRSRLVVAALVVPALGLALASVWLPMPGAEALKLQRSALLAAGLGWLVFRRGADGPAHPRLAALALLVGAADLVAVGRGQNPLAPAELVGHRPALLDALPADGRRVHAATEQLACLAPRAGIPAGDPVARALAFLEALRPPSGIGHALPGSYDGEFTGLGSRFAAPLTAAVHASWGTSDALRLLQLGGVGHVVLVGSRAPAGLEPLWSAQSLYACPLWLLRVPGSRPPAFVVHASRPEGPEGALREVTRPDFDPSREAVVPRGAELAPLAAAAAPAGSSARVVSRRANELEVAAQLEAEGILVLTEAYDEGWRARVDGREVAPIRVNGLFRGLRLPAGAHVVRFAYEPPGLRAGAALGAAGAAAVVALVALGARHDGGPGNAALEAAAGATPGKGHA